MASEVGDKCETQTPEGCDPENKDMGLKWSSSESQPETRESGYVNPRESGYVNPAHRESSGVEQATAATEPQPVESQESPGGEKAEDSAMEEGDAVQPSTSQTPEADMDSEERDEVSPTLRSSDHEEKGAKPKVPKTDSQYMAALDREEAQDPAECQDFPKTLEGFKYGFNENGEMRHLETGEPFEFKVSEDYLVNQRRYEAIGELVTDHVYGLLKTECRLHPIEVPLDVGREEPKSFFYMSEDAMSNTRKLLIIIHGSGVVRAGQWSRKLIMNNDIDKGTQIPYIKRAMKDGFGVMVLNTNLNYAERNGEKVAIKYNSNPEEHALYVWENFVTLARARLIAIVAHSYGGIVTTELAISKEAEFQKRVFAIAFTDSVHDLEFQEAPKSVVKYFEKHARNWVSSDRKLDTPVITSREKDAPKYSAGTTKHEWTSHCAIESIFKWFKKAFIPAAGKAGIV